MSLGTEKLEALAKEIVELAKDIAAIMEDKKVSYSDAVAIAGAAKDVYDVADLVGGAYAEIKDLQKDELAKVGEIATKLIKDVSEIYGLKL